MRTHRQIVAGAGKDGEIAEKIGVKPHQPRDWRIRDSIPPEHWRSFVANEWTTLEELAAAAELKPGRSIGAAA